jgi:hypothetical protein
MSSRGAIIAVLLAVLASCASARADNSGFGKRVTGDTAIVSLIRGNTLQGTLDQTGERWTEFYCDTGKSLYDFEQTIFLGKWWIEHDQVCFSYDWSDYQHVNCFDLYAQTDGSLIFDAKADDDSPAMTFRSGPPIAGDPNHLEQHASHGCRPEPSV